MAGVGGRVAVDEVVVADSKIVVVGVVVLRPVVIDLPARHPLTLFGPGRVFGDVKSKGDVHLEIDTEGVVWYIDPDGHTELGRREDVDRHARFVGKIRMVRRLSGGRITGVEDAEDDDLVRLPSHDPPVGLAGEALPYALGQVPGDTLLVGGPLLPLARHVAASGTK